MSAGRRRRERGGGGIAWFMAAVVAAAGAAGVAIYFAILGWREDRDSPPSFYFDEAGQKVEFLGTTNFRHIAVVVNLTLVGLGSFIGLLSLVGVIVCVREVCDCCRPSYASSNSTGRPLDVKVVAAHPPPGHYPTTAGSAGWFEPSDRLSRWLHHQYIPQWVRPKQWNGQPFSPLFHTMASASYSSGSYSSDAASRNYGQAGGSLHRSKDPKRIQKEENRRRRAKQKKKELKELKKQRRQEEKARGVTEEEVASTYTGLDREMAEEFISVSMEPGRTINRVMNHSDNEHDLSSSNHNSFDRSDTYRS